MVQIKPMETLNTKYLVPRIYHVTKTLHTPGFFKDKTVFLILTINKYWLLKNILNLEFHFRINPLHKYPHQCKRIYQTHDAYHSLSLLNILNHLRIILTQILALSLLLFIEKISKKQLIKNLSKEFLGFQLVTLSSMAW